MSRDHEHDPGGTTPRSAPPGITLIRSLRGQNWSFKTYRYLILVVTFIAYALYHASRKPSSIVRSVLHHGPSPARGGQGWPPFAGHDGASKLGETDVAFLSCYALGMYVAGHLGDRLDLRVFLAAGMIGSGIFVSLFGMGYFWNVHVFGFYLSMQMAAGLFQATGWPSVVAVIGNWFGKRKRGLIMGIWNAHTSIGNIVGSLLAAGVLEFGWGWSFIFPGGLMFAGGILVFLFLAAYPEDLGFSGEQDGDKEKGRETTGNEEKRQGSVGRRSVGLLEACLIPGVIPFAMCLFFCKLVAYTFLFWLPYYLTQTEIGGEYMSVKSAGNLSTLFDVGGIVGGILAGYVSDKLRARATTAATFMFAAIPSLLAYRAYGGASRWANAALMMVAGLFVNGPYALITTAVSADLGTHSSLRGDSRALATVTAIIDGTGSVGATLGPLLTGFLSTRGWDSVFAMLVLGALVAALLLSPLVFAEISETRSKPGDSNQPLLTDQA